MDNSVQAKSWKLFRLARVYTEREKERMNRNENEDIRRIALDCGTCRSFPGHPGYGGAFVISAGYSPLGVMFVRMRSRCSCFRGTRKSGPILGIITSTLAWIRVVGGHEFIDSDIVLLISACSFRTHSQNLTLKYRTFRITATKKLPAQRCAGSFLMRPR
jgi:hypothetical protein